MGCGGGRHYMPFPIPPVLVPEERNQPSSKDILKTRLATGEITLEEYQHMMNVLQGDTRVYPSRPTPKSHIRMP